MMRVDDHISIVRVNLVFCQLNSFNFFLSYKKTNKSCSLLLYFNSILIGRRDFFFHTALLLSILTPYVLRLFLCLISFLLFPCASVCENTRA